MRSLLAVIVVALAPSLVGAGSFVNFESGHVRPIAFVASADLLFAVNTPDDRLGVFQVSNAGLARIAEVPVGLEPVAVATRSLPGGKIQAWVVNHLSDSISIVEVDVGNPSAARVVRTLLVGDEPRDIVVAGSGGNRVFIATAHRGQNRPSDPQLLVPGTPRADVWVFDADNLGTGLGGTPLTIVECFGDTPRALAASADGTKVYAAVFHSGNGTTTLNERTVSSHGGLPPGPLGAIGGAPPTGLIVQRNPSTGEWNDELGRNWSSDVPFSLPDYDLFVIDADAGLPAVTSNVAHVGTTIFKIAERPVDGKLYVANTEARNGVRFEPVLRGHLAENRVTVIDGASVTSAHLNAHIDYDVVPGPPAEIEQSLAIPIDLVFSPDGSTLYLAAFGSGKIAVLDPTSLDAGTAFPRATLDVGGGPSGLALDSGRDRLYVLTRFDQQIVIVEAASQATRAIAGAVSIGFDPSPPEVSAGRRFLYDARTTSAHGDEACASCHLFGDMDDLAWDLGDPFGMQISIPTQTIDLASAPNFGNVAYHPMKGPMLTQSLRGLLGTGPMHWRGDRSGATGGGSGFDALASLTTFNVAFPSLLGRASELDPTEMEAFARFVLTLRYPPNPIRPLAGLSAQQTFGQDTFLHPLTDGASTCVSCHRLPLGTGGNVAIGFPFFQPIKVPHLRNAYQKVGRFGLVAGDDHGLTPYLVGDQVRGFGLEFNGSLASVFDFHGPQFALSPPQRDAVSDFVLAFDTGLDAAVGQQTTVEPSNAGAAVVADRVALLADRAEAGACDLVVKGIAAGKRRGWEYEGAGKFRSDRQADEILDTATLQSQGATVGAERTFTCVPPGSGARIGLDRDGDGIGDTDELDNGSDPDDPLSVPASLQLVPIATASLQLKDRSRLPAKPKNRKLQFKASTKDAAPAFRVVPPASGGPGDPRIHGATLDVFNAAGSEEIVTIALPPSKWRVIGNALAPKGYRFDDKTYAVSSVRVQTDQIQIKAGGATWRYTLDEPSQTAIAVRLRLGLASMWCATAPAAIGKDKVDQFVGIKGAAPPLQCPQP